MPRWGQKCREQECPCEDEGGRNRRLGEQSHGLPTRQAKKLGWKQVLPLLSACSLRNTLGKNPKRKRSAQSVNNGIPSMPGIALPLSLCCQSWRAESRPWQVWPQWSQSQAPKVLHQSSACGVRVMLPEPSCFLCQPNNLVVLTWPEFCK